jgi:hypothetical protein
MSKKKLSKVIILGGLSVIFAFNSELERPRSLMRTFSFDPVMSIRSLRNPTEQQ